MTKKTRSNTLQERFGFKDNDLKTPEHDNIMMWLDKNIDQVLSELFESGWSQNVVQKYSFQADEFMKKKRQYFEDKIIKHEEQNRDKLKDGNVNQSSSSLIGLLDENGDQSYKEYVEILNHISSWRGMGKPPGKPSIGVKKKIWESAISTESRNKFTIGFIDMEAIVNIPQLSIENAYVDSRYYEDILSPKLPSWYLGEYPSSILFEVKTKIPSIGELIRQIRMYQEHKNGTYVVVSPDDRFEQILNEQEIWFYKCPHVSKSNAVNLDLFN